jgi:Zn finger protein HypA/HybF involved in hydrogenase expression
MNGAEGGNSSSMDMCASDLPTAVTRPPTPLTRKRVLKSNNDSSSSLAAPLLDYRPRAYPDDSTGPWVVYFQPKTKPLNVVQISADLTRRYSAISHISMIRKNKMCVTVTSLKQANEIAVSPFYTLEYRVYIPARKVEIQGVVTETSLTPDILEKQGVGRFKNPLLPPVKILEVKQLGSVSVSEGKKSFTPTASFRVTFAGSALPQFVELGKLRLPIRLFVPKVMSCENCRQLGHTASHCGNKARCPKCGERHEDGGCKQSAPICLHCKQAPPHDLLACPVYKQRGEKLARSLKDRSKQSFAEMLKRATPTNDQNKFALLSEEESDIDLAGEMESSGSLGNPSRKRRRTRLQKSAIAKPRTSMPKLKSGGKKEVSIPPGFLNSGYNQEFPPLPGTSKTPDAPVFRTEVPASSGMFSFDQIVDKLLNFLELSDPLKSIVLAMLPAVKSFVKQLTSKWPFLSAIISFDG